MIVLAIVLLAWASQAYAHPGSGITVDAEGNVYFVDTGRGVWRLDASGKLVLIHKLAWHWMAMDERGASGSSRPLGSFDRGSFEVITPAGTAISLIISSDYPIAVGGD